MRRLVESVLAMRCQAGGAAQFLRVEDVAPDGAGLIMAFYYQSVAPTAREGWREPAKQRSYQPRWGRNICRKPPPKSNSPVRGDLFHHDFTKTELRPKRAGWPPFPFHRRAHSLSSGMIRARLNINISSLKLTEPCPRPVLV
jgi:hypothetical protein